MGTVWINIEAMTAYVAALESAIETSRWVATDLQSKCSQAEQWDPDCASFMNGESTVELEAVLADARRSLELALLVAESNVSFGGFTGDLPSVPVDTELIDSFGQGQEWADKVDAGTMTAADWVALEDSLTASWGQWVAAGLFASVSPQVLADTLGSLVQGSLVVPGWLVTAVLVCQGDPGCEDAVTRAFPPDLLGYFLCQIQSVQADMAYWEKPGLEDYLADENVLLYGLAGCLSGSVSRMGTDELGQYTASWVSRVQDSLFGTADVPMLGLIVGRGQWPSSFLTGFADAIGLMESKAGTGSAAWRPIVGDVLDPDTDFQSGNHLVSNDPMGGVFRSAALYDPQWFLDRYTGGDTTSVEVGVGEAPTPDTVWVTGSHMVDADQALYGLFRRDWDAGSLAWFQQAVGMSALSDPTQGEALLTDLGNNNDSIKYAVDQWENLTFWEQYHHEVLGLGAFALAIMALAVPGVGPAAAGGAVAGGSAASSSAAAWTAGLLFLSNTAIAVDAGYYWAEGHKVAAGLEIALVAVPFLIGGVVKWVRLSASEFKALQIGDAILADNGKLLTLDNLVDVRLIDAAWHPKGYFPPAIRGVPTRADVNIIATIDVEGNLTASSAEALGRLATMNHESSYVVLGQWAKNSTKSYEQTAFAAQGTYYDLGSSYNMLYHRLIARGLTDEAAKAQLWQINQSFLQQQVNQGKTFYFTVNPTDQTVVSTASGTYQEWAYLKACGYRLENFGPYWKAVR